MATQASPDIGLRNAALEQSTTTYLQGGCGIRNADLTASIQTYHATGTWKKQRIVGILPAGRSMPSRVALAWRNLITPPNQPAPWILAEGDEVGVAYSNTFDYVLHHPDLSQFEYIATLEHDNIGPPDGLLRLIQRMEEHPEFACISGLYWTKGEGGVPQCWGSPQEDPVVNYRPQVPRPGEVMEVYGTGMGFALWRISSMLSALPKWDPPWTERAPSGKKALFKTKASLSEGVGTQDLAFWGEARKVGLRGAVDCGVLVGHLDSNGVVW